MTYVEALRECSIPNPEQTRRFAEKLADAHSWYKHLPVHPPTPCVLHLVPWARGHKAKDRIPKTASWEAGWPSSSAVRWGGDTGLRVAGYSAQWWRRWTGLPKQRPRFSPERFAEAVLSGA